MKRSADGASVNRLPAPIQNKYLMFEYDMHLFPKSIGGKLADSARGATEKLGAVSDSLRLARRKPLSKRTIKQQDFNEVSRVS